MALGFGYSAPRHTGSNDAADGRREKNVWAVQGAQGWSVRDVLLAALRTHTPNTPVRHCLEDVHILCSLYIPIRRDMQKKTCSVFKVKGLGGGQPGAPP